MAGWVCLLGCADCLNFNDDPLYATNKDPLAHGTWDLLVYTVCTSKT